jgi:hypothetical protein
MTHIFPNPSLLTTYDELRIPFDDGYVTQTVEEAFLIKQ